MTPRPGSHLGILSPACARGGCEEYLIAVARDAARRYERVTVWIPDVGGVQTVRRDLSALGINIGTIAAPEPGPLAETERLRLVSDAVAVLTRQPVDRLILVLPGIDVGGSFIDAAALAGIPALVLYQLAWPHHFQESERQVYAFARRQRQEWYAVSEDNRRLVLSALDWDAGVDVRPNALLSPFPGVEGTERAAIRRNVREELGLSTSASMCVTVARLDPQKGVDTAVAVAARVIATNPDAHFVWVGDGFVRDDAMASIRALGLDQRFHLVGRRRDVPRFLNAADVFLLPSRYEGRPFAVLEAMAAGLPCVLSDIGPHRDLVQDGIDGRLVPVDDANGFASAVKGLFDEPGAARQMGLEARARATTFEPGRYFDRLFATVERLDETRPLPWPGWPLARDRTRRRIAIYGTGSGGRCAFDELCATAEVVAFIDSQTGKQGQLLLDRPIVGPADVAALDVDAVVLASCFYDSMRTQLLAVGYPSEQIEIFPQWRLGLPRHDRRRQREAA